jgi:hypothetical protein
VVFNGWRCDLGQRPALLDRTARSAAGQSRRIVMYLLKTKTVLVIVAAINVAGCAPAPTRDYNAQIAELNRQSDLILATPKPKVAARPRGSPQRTCRDSQVISEMYVGSDLRAHMLHSCDPGDLLVLERSPHGVAMFCDMKKPIIREGISTICTMATVPRESY